MSAGGSGLSVAGFYVHMGALLAAARCGYALASGSPWQELWLLALVVAMGVAVFSGLAGLEGWIDAASAFAVFRWQLVAGAALGAFVGLGACAFVLLASLSLVPSGLRAGIVGVSVVAFAQTAAILAATVATFGLYGFVAARVAWRVARDGGDATFDSVLDEDPPPEPEVDALATPLPPRPAPATPPTGTAGWREAERALADLAHGRAHPGHAAGTLAGALRLAPLLEEAEAARGRVLIVRLCSSEQQHRADARSADGDPDARPTLSVAEQATRALNAWDAARGPAARPR